MIKKNDLYESDGDYLSPDKESRLLTDSTAKSIFSQGIELYNDSVLWNHKFFKLPIDDDYDLILGAMKKGEGKKMLGIMNDILEGVKPIEDILDIDLWCAYLSLIHFGSFNDILNNNNPFGISRAGLLFPTIHDFDNFNPFADESFNNNWDDIFENNNSVSGGLIKLIIQRFKDSDYAMKRLALVYEDLLNTSLHSDRTIAIVEDMEKEVMKYYTEKYLSWGGEPNGGIPPESQNHLYHKLKNYFRERPDSASFYLANYLLKDENYQLEDRNQVEVNFDGIPRGVVLLKLNSLDIDSNFSGLYFPQPNLQIEYQVKEGYDIYIKEYPSLGSSFELSADQPIKLTFLTKNEK